MDRPGVREVPEGSGEQGKKWRKLVMKSSVVPQRPLRLRDRWWWCRGNLCCAEAYFSTSFWWKTLHMFPTVMIANLYGVNDICHHIHCHHHLHHHLDGLTVATLFWLMIFQPSLPTPFYSVLVSVSIFMALSTVFHSINSPDSSLLSWLHSSGHISALLVLSTVYLFMKVSLSPDITPNGWLGLKHQLTN